MYGTFQLLFLNLFFKSAVQKGSVPVKQFYAVLTQYGIRRVDHVELILKLLCKFEIIVKLDADNILIPSLLGDTVEGQTALIQPFFFPPIDKVCSASDRKTLFLHSNRSCYRRIFMAPHVPVSFWSRFIARCLSCNHFCQILVRCNANIAIERCPIPSQIVVDGELFQWHYGKRNISLLFGSHVLLTVNSIDNGFSKTKIKYFDFSEEAPMECQYKEGFVVYVPSYTAVTMKDDDDLQHNETFSAQILAHVLELIDQVMRDYFEGLLDQGIYNDNFLLQLIPCPFCFGDKYHGTVNLNNAEDIDQDARYNDILFCFSVQFCLQRQQELEDVVCFRIHNMNLLEIRHIAPDLVCSNI